MISSLIFHSVTNLSLSDNMHLSTLHLDPTGSRSSFSFPKYLLQVGEVRAQISLGAVWRLYKNMFPVLRRLGTLFFLSWRYGTKDVWLSSRAVFTTLNVHLPTINSIVGAMILGPMKKLPSAYNVHIEDINLLRYSMEMLNTLAAVFSLTYHRLIKKRGMNLCFYVTWI